MIHSTSYVFEGIRKSGAIVGQFVPGVDGDETGLGEMVGQIAHEGGITGNPTTTVYQNDGGKRPVA